MSRIPSEATQIRNLKRELAEVRGCYNRSMLATTQYRERATKAEQEVKEWRERFDTLLRVTELKLKEPE